MRHVSELWRASRSLVPDVKAPTTTLIAILTTADPALGESAFIEGRGRSYAVVPPRSDHVEPEVAAAIVRQFVHNASADVPLWVEVGVGEFLSTLELAQDESTVKLGKPIAAHLATLRRGLFQMPVILGATAESPVYTDASQRVRFVAQSWLLVHYLCANDQRRPQIGAFVQALSREPPESAFRTVFRTDYETMGLALADYFAKGRFQPSEVAAGRPKGDMSETTRSLSPTESEALIADALVQAGKAREALARLRPLSSGDAHVRDVQAVSARALAQQGDRRAALHLFAQSMPIEGGLDYREQSEITDLREYYYAATLLNISSSLDLKDLKDIRADDAQLAAKLLTDFLTRVSEHGDALALLGVAELAMQNVGGAIQRLTEAFRSCPRHQYALWLARAHVASGDVSGARQILEPLAERGRPQAVRVASQRMLKSLPISDAPPRQTFPVFREPKAGELKASGVLTDIACSPTWVIFHVTLADRELIVATARLDLVDFISHRPDSVPNTGCGKRGPGERVSIIWLPDPSAPAGTEGYVSAVEFPGSID